MYAEELTALIRSKASYPGGGRNDYMMWRAAIDKACEVVDTTLPHQPKDNIEKPTMYVAETTPETPVKKFGKKKEE